MYIAYFVNTITGQLVRTSQPKDNPKGEEWKQIGDSEFELLKRVADFAMHGWYQINK